MKVVLANFAWLYDRSIFLPLSAGMLTAYCEADEEFRKRYEIDHDFLFVRDDPEKIAQQALAAGVDVLGFSTYIWNEALSLDVARRVKAARPECMIVFGGQSISQWPEVNEAFLRANPFIDVAVRGEGEITFKELLLAHARAKWMWRRAADSRPLAVAGVSSALPGISFLTGATAFDSPYDSPGNYGFVFGPERKRERDLTVFPSPYLAGTFDTIMSKHPDLDWQGLWETNRGCVYEAFAKGVVALPDKLVRPETLTYSEAFPFPVGICRVPGHTHRSATEDARFLFQGRQAVYKHALSNGLSLWLTPEHPVSVVRDDKRTMVPSRMISEGDWVALERGQNSVKRLVCLDKRKLRELRAEGRGDARRNLGASFPSKVGVALGWVLGLLLGDGSLGSYTNTRKSGSQKGCVVLTHTVSFAVVTRDGRKVARKLAAVFGVPPAIRALSNTVEAVSLTYSAKNIYLYLTNVVGIAPSGSGNKLRLPDVIARSPREVVRSFLDGLYYADGYKPTNKEPYLTTVSKSFAEEVAAAIYWIGDVALVRKIKRVHKKGDYRRSPLVFRVEWHGTACDSKRGNSGSLCLRTRIPTANAIGRTGAYNAKLTWRRPLRANFQGVGRRSLAEFDPRHPLLGDSWAYARVTAIRYKGSMFVYDVHNHPTHRFTVSGASVHNCSFCSWSALALGAKLGVFPMPRLLQELDWFAEKKIKHVYCCDANAGIMPRDVEWVDALVERKKTRGYPRSFFVNTAKNATKKIFDLAKKLHDAGMSKSLILSMQSMDEQTLANVRRDNIKVSTYHDLMKLSREIGMATCSELILGLPGETLESFCAGIEHEIDARQMAIFLYFCVVLPASEMAKPVYIKEHGIQTARVTILANHADLAEDDRSVPEYEDVVVATKTMPYEDWLEANRVAWFVYSFFCLGLATFPLLWLKEEHGVRVTDFARWAMPRFREGVLGREKQRLDDYVASIRAGTPTVPRDGIEDSLPIRWPIEEATFLAVSHNLDEFYGEFKALVVEYTGGVPARSALIDEIFAYQEARIVRPTGPAEFETHYSWNLPEYFDALMRLEKVPLESRRQMLAVTGVPYESFDEFSKKGVWFARRGGSFFYPATWYAPST